MSTPLLAPHAQLAWTDRSHLVAEDPAAAHTRVIIGNATAVVVRWLRGCDGSRSEAVVLDEAVSLGIHRESAVDILHALAEAGLLASDVDDPGGPADVARRSALRQDLEAIALCGREAGSAYRRRQEHHVWIEGSNRIAHALAEVLAASHIGSLQARAHHTTTRAVTLRDVGAFGPHAEDVGSAPSVALRRHIERLTNQHKGVRRPIVIACEAHLDPAEEVSYQEAGVPYLRVLATSRFATIGPLTLPGHSVCWSCIALHRTDADPQWPHVLAQFDQQRRASAPIDNTFAIWIASEVSSHLLRVIDTDDPSTLVNTTFHIDRASTDIVRRTWRVHPECPCQWRYDSAA